MKEELLEEQVKTLNIPRRKYGLLAKLLFSSMDLIYGRKATFSKFKVLEVIARVPYQSWEHVAYIAVTHRYGKPDFARRIFDFVQESRQQQDNEQWHLLILEEIVQRRDIRESFILHRVLPQIIAFLYYHVSWILYVIKPALSYRLNADFEDHAEHEYMKFVSDHPEFEVEEFHSGFEKEYGVYKSMAHLLRRIGFDEREHKLESERRISEARFS
jgi:ubiquinol oxidase